MDEYDRWKLKINGDGGKKIEREDFTSHQMIVANYPEELNSYNFNDPNPRLLQPVKPEEFLPSISRWITIGGSVLLTAFGAALILASVLKYKITVKANAIIRPAGELRLVQALTEGYVKHLVVEPNQIVNQGDVIAYLDDSRLQTKKSQLQSNIQLYQLQLNQINAQIFAVERQIKAETNQLKGILAGATASLSLSLRNWQDRQITTAAEVREAEAEVQLAQDELKRYQQLSHTGAVSQLQVREKETALRTVNARLEKVKAYLNPSDAEVAIAKEKIAEEKARGEATLAMLNKEKEQLIQKQVEIHNQIARDERELTQLEAEIAATVVRVPVSGIIQELNLRNVSQVVSPGAIIARIAPSNNPVKIKASVASKNISQVALGQQVQMRVSACPYTDYGTLEGLVTAISPDAIRQSLPAKPIAPQDNSISTSFLSKIAPGDSIAYEVTIEPKSLTLGQGKRICVIQSGMEGQAEIISQEETVLAFILRKTRLITS